MPRDLPLGNGTLLVNFDSTYTLRDIYYPHIGQENQTEGHDSHMGVWASSAGGPQFAWVDGDGWERNLCYKDETLATDVTLKHTGLGLQIDCTDVVDFHENVLVRHFKVTDLSGNDREVRLFFHHDFHLYGNDVGDTAYFDPYSHALIHYKLERYFLMLGGTVREGKLQVGLDGYATGVKEVGGKEGTWRDAEDGVLGKNPMSQGSVDSVAQVNVTVPAHGSGEAYFWVAAANSHSEVVDLNDKVLERTPQQLIRRTVNYWRLWVNKEDFDYEHCPTPIVETFKRSLLILQTQIDRHGAIIAANDADIVVFARDTYSYMWPRDGALTAYALMLAGYDQATEDFFTFCQQIISTHGYFLHKYNPDGSLASSWQPWVSADGSEEQLPIQEDETALVLWSLWEFFKRAHNVEFVGTLFRPLVVAAADFMTGYVDHRTGLPLPSWDLWEERRGVMAFTVGAVYAGLMGASKIAEAFGEMEMAKKYSDAAEGIKNAVEEHMYDPQLGRFVRMVTVNADGSVNRDSTIDASMFGLWYFGMFDVDDERITRTMDAIHDALWCQTQVGGMARYENDYYQRVSAPPGQPPTPGNPWFVCTMWYTQYLITKAANEEELHQAFPLLQWATERCLPSGVMAEQVDPYTGAPLSVAPLTWSHAAYVTALLEYLDRHSEMVTCVDCGGPRYFRERKAIVTAHRRTEWQQAAT
jgi:glucoamylase